ncbi:Hypothetical predicted protein, partial [Marmota monax]
EDTLFNTCGPPHPGLPVLREHHLQVHAARSRSSRDQGKVLMLFYNPVTPS